jgi:hypothetical protein
MTGMTTEELAELIVLRLNQLLELIEEVLDEED